MAKISKDLFLSWLNDEKLGQGRDKSKEFLANNPDILNTVETLVREKLAQNV